MAFAVGKDLNESVSTNPDAADGSSADEGTVKNWPGRSEPGHIRPIGPAYRQKPSDSGEVTDENK